MRGVLRTFAVGVLCALVVLLQAPLPAFATGGSISGGKVGAPAGAPPSAGCLSPSANISIALNAHRISGPAPLGVNFSTLGTTNSLGYEYPELTYVWDFDDPGATAWQDGSDANFEGFKTIVAGHLFETPGTFNPVLVVVAPSGVCSTATVEITVEDPDTVYAGALTTCIGNSLPTAGAGGCPSGASVLASSDFDAALASCDAGGERCLFEGDGDSYTASTVKTFTTDDNYIGSYYATTPPVLTDAGAFPSDQYVGSTNADQLVVTGFTVDMNTAGKDFVARTTSATNVTHNLTVAFITGTGGQVLRMDNGHSNANGVNSGTFVAHVTWDGCDGGSGDYCIWAKGKRTSYIGNDLDMQELGEHVFRSGMSIETVIAHSIFKSAASAKGEVKLHALEAADPAAFAERDSEFIYFGWNDLISTAGNPTLAIGPQDVSSDEFVHDWIGESNYCDAGPASQICFKLQVTGETWMFNTLCDLTGMVAAHECIVFEKSGGLPTGTPTNLYAYGTTVFDDDAGVSTEAVSFKMGVAPRVCANTLLIGDGTLDACLGADTETSSRASATRPFETSPPTARAHFKITAGSGPDDAGTCVDGLEYDFEGDERPQGAACDIGADEEETP